MGSPSTLHGLRILCVDDDADTCELVTKVLEQVGAQVKAVASVPEALQVFQAWRPDLLIADIQIPGLDGYALIEQVRTLPPNYGGQIPALALSAHAYASYRQKALAAGFQHYMTKPFEPSALIKRLARLVNRNRWPYVP